MNLIVDNLHTALDDHGTGDVVVMLHGWGSDRSSFAQLAADLAKTHRVIRIDLPGFGGSQAPQSAWHIHDYVSFVEKVLQKRKVSKISVLVGHSMGGRIGLQACGRKKLQPKKLVLLGSHGIAHTTSLRTRIFKIIAKAGKTAAVVLPAQYQKRLQSALYRRAGSSDYLLAGPLKETFKNIIAADARSDAAHIQAETLLIYGSDDDQTPPEFGQIFADLIPKSRLEVIEGAGHYVHTDRHDLVAPMIKEFIS